MFKERAAKRRVTIQMDIDEETSAEPLVVDPVKLKQIIFNLLSNAVKFTPEGGRIGLKAQKRGPDVLFSITDTGIGISSENKERIFEAFEQVDSSLDRKTQGTGLGLTLTKRMVELHGGKIWVESDGENKGSTFSFLLPLAENPTAP
jgi:signal transduction histidine kinase